MKKKSNQKGSLIVEYALITLFTLTITLGVLAYLQNVFRSEFESIAKDFGVEESLFQVSFFKKD